MKIDKTIINLLTILIGGAGLFSVLSKFYTPELNQTFMGANPFLIKRDYIETTMTYIFIAVTFLGILFQACKEIYDDKIPQRLYSFKFYGCFFITGLVFTIIGVLLLVGVGNKIARIWWQPVIVAGQREIFEDAEFIVEHDGWRKGQLDNKINFSEYDRKNNLDQAQEHILQVEKLLDIKNQKVTLKIRVNNLKKYFGS